MSLVQLRQASVDVHAFSFFVLRSPAPPRPTLFPYTTLFRSSARRRARDDAPRSTARNAPRENRDDDASPTATDRKSTRLNSSHVEISYAVFCLKKKKCLRCGKSLLDHAVPIRAYASTGSNRI